MKIKFAASILVSLLSLIFSHNEAPANTRIYAETLCVVDIHQTIGDEETEDIIFSTFTGNLYSITVDSSEDILKGDLFAAIMSDEGTDEVYNDKIIDFTYQEFVSEWGYDPYRNQALFTFEK